MTTDPIPDWEQLLAKLGRVIEVLEDIRDARRGKTTQRPPTPEEVVRFARGGRVKPPEGGQPIARGAGCVITADQLRSDPRAREVLKTFREEIADNLHKHQNE